MKGYANIALCWYNWRLWSQETKSYINQRSENSATAFWAHQKEYLKWDTASPPLEIPYHLRENHIQDLEKSKNSTWGASLNGWRTKHNLIRTRLSLDIGLNPRKSYKSYCEYLIIICPHAKLVEVGNMNNQTIFISLDYVIEFMVLHSCKLHQSHAASE